jgi:SAM-dependent methyltransferase
VPNRADPLHQARYAARHPERIPAHMRRLIRDVWLRASTRDHVAYYRAVMRSDAARNAPAAGGRNPQSWQMLAQSQYDYLIRHGLKPSDRMLEIGCGNLRVGWRFIDYLESGNYYGVDISPDLLMSAERTLIRHELQAKLPHLTVVDNLTLGFLPADHFTVVHAHGVFSHSPLPVIEQCLAHVGRLLAPDGFCDFTFDRTDGPEHHVLWEDFYYRTETLVDLAAGLGLEAEFMDDWERLPHKQSRIRVSRPSA